MGKEQSDSAGPPKMMVKCPLRSNCKLSHLIFLKALCSLPLGNCDSSIVTLQYDDGSFLRLVYDATSGWTG